MQARYYDPTIGRFLSVDPKGFRASRPEMFNRYAYAANVAGNTVAGAAINANAALTNQVPHD